MRPSFRTYYWAACIRATSSADGGPPAALISAPMAPTFFTAGLRIMPPISQAMIAARPPTPRTRGRSGARGRRLLVRAGRALVRGGREGRASLQERMIEGPGADRGPGWRMERETGFEPATFSLEG